MKAVSCLGATHIPKRVDENGKTYEADADDAAYATFELEGGVIAHINSSWCVRVRRDDLVTFQLDGTHGSAVCRPDAMLDPEPREHAAPGLESRRAADHELLLAMGGGDADNDVYDNGFKMQWEDFIRHVVADTPWKYDLIEGVKGRAARRARLEELARAALARRARDQDLSDRHADDRAADQES